MKKTIYTAILAAAALLASSCSDFLDKKSSAYDSEGFYKSEAGLNEGLTAVYRQLIYDQNWGVAAPQMQDVYCPYGLQNEENNTISAGPGLTPDQSYVASYWNGHFAAVGRANNCISGAAIDFNALIEGNGPSDTYLRRLAETYALRGYAYYNLLQAFGDLPLLTRAATPDDATMPLTDKQEIAQYFITELSKLADAKILPFYPEQKGRVGNGMLSLLVARYAMLAGSHNFNDKANEYFEIAAKYAKYVMDEGGLAQNYGDLFTTEGQSKADVQKEILWAFNYAYGSQNLLTNLRLGHALLTAGGSTVRFASPLLAVIYECTDGKRIDESDLYDPTKPYMNRDPRMEETLLMHGQEFWYDNGKKAVRINIYDPTCMQFPKPTPPKKGTWYSWTNMDTFTSHSAISDPGVGVIWNKYNKDMTEFIGAACAMDLIVMRVAEAYNTYAEAMIELDKFSDPTVAAAINEVRARVNMPKIEVVDPTRTTSKDKMRQIVRRERKAEFGMEGLLLTDFRRWQIGDILNAGPIYGQPVPEIRYEGLTRDDLPNFKKDARHDINDVPDYTDVADKYTFRDAKRFWKPCFMWWPIPRAELDKNPNFHLAEGY